ncbi:MAG: hypothetical protein KJ971_05835 [Firmicutes bacterium]|nr:hypothetical protein [Bacillota bacterium]
MRKHDVFGRKINQIKIIYLIVIIFIAVFAFRFVLLEIQANKLALLEAEQVSLQIEINDLLSSHQDNTYHEIDEIIISLPNSYQQFMMVEELNLIRNSAGLANATNYQYEFIDDVNSPFPDDLPSSIKFVRIELSFRISDPDLILDYLDLLSDATRIYFLNAINVTYSLDGAIIDMEIYSFYNDIDLS